jgi:hypothetical protein
MDLTSKIDASGGGSPTVPPCGINGELSGGGGGGAGGLIGLDAPTMLLSVVMANGGGGAAGTTLDGCPLQYGAGDTPSTWNHAAGGGGTTTDPNAGGAGGYVNGPATSGGSVNGLGTAGGGGGGVGMILVHGSPTTPPMASPAPVFH